MSDEVLRTIELNGKELKLLECALIKYSKEITDRGKHYAPLRRISRMLEKAKEAQPTASGSQT
jgi:hypothetical protein